MDECRESTPGFSIAAKRLLSLGGPFFCEMLGTKQHFSNYRSFRTGLQKHAAVLVITDQLHKMLLSFFQ